MKLSELSVGMRVHAPDPHGPDSESGVVRAINPETGFVLIGWDSHQSSEIHADALEPEETES